LKESASKHLFRSSEETVLYVGAPHYKNQSSNSAAIGGVFECPLTSQSRVNCLPKI